MKAPDLDIRIDYLFFEIILKFLEFMENTIFHKNEKSAYRIAKFEYFTKIVAYSKSPDHMFQTMYDMFIFTESEIFSNLKNDLNLKIFSRIAQKVMKSKYFPNS